MCTIHDPSNCHLNATKILMIRNKESRSLYSSLNDQADKQMDFGDLWFHMCSCRNLQRQTSKNPTFALSFCYQHCILVLH